MGGTVASTIHRGFAVAPRTVAASQQMADSQAHSLAIARSSTRGGPSRAAIRVYLVRGSNWNDASRGPPVTTGFRPPSEPSMTRPGTMDVATP